MLDFELPPGANGESPENDFYPETVSECGLGMLFYSTVYAYHADHYKECKPETIADFFDLETFPGRRGMRRVPAVNLEFALMADGVPRDEVYRYPRHARGGQSRIPQARHHQGSGGLVGGRRAAAADARRWRSGDDHGVQRAHIQRAGFGEAVVYYRLDGQVLDIGQLVIAAGAPNLEAARQFLAFAARPSSMAGVGRYIAYAPARRSGMDLISLTR